MKPLLSLLLVLITITHAEDQFFETSYDCAKTTERSVERSVCTDEHLAKLDKELSIIYTSFYYVTQEIKSDQREWMKQKNQCKNTACIQKAYESRIADLNASLNNEKTFPKSFLNRMKLVQTQMEYFIDPSLSGALGDTTISEKDKAEIRDDIQKSGRFQEDFFRFKNIYFKPPLIAKAKNYNDPSLKKILGSCHAYQFDQSIDITYEKRARNQLPLYVAEKQDIEDFKLSVWSVTVKGKQWFFLYTPTASSEVAYLVDVLLCQQPHTKDNLIQALNTNSRHIRTESGFMNQETTAMIVNYKNKDYFMSTNYDENKPSSDYLFTVYLSNFLSKPTHLNPISRFFDAGFEILYRK